jgi:hypothetical protein
MMPPRPFTRWITPQGMLIDLIHVTHTSRNRGRKGLRDGGTWDGWCLITRHPVSGTTLDQVYLGADVPEDQLQAALDAVHAVPMIRPKRASAPHRPVGR